MVAQRALPLSELLNDALLEIFPVQHFFPEITVASASASASADAAAAVAVAVVALSS